MTPRSGTGMVPAVAEAIERVLPFRAEIPGRLPQVAR
jgi:hypothetical protein